MPLKRSEVIEAFYDAHLKLFKCPFPDYQVTSKRKSNLKRHIKSCETQKNKKKKKKKGKLAKTHALNTKKRIRRNTTKADM